MDVEAKARALADKLTGAVTVDLYLHDDAEPHIEIVGAEAMILAFAEEVRRDAWERAARIAGDGCLVPPDGGSPTTEEFEMCERIAAAIRAPSDAPAGPDPTVALVAALLRRACQMFDASGESLRSARARTVEAAFRLIHQDQPAFRSEYVKCDTNPLEYLFAAERAALALAEAP